MEKTSSRRFFAAMMMRSVVDRHFSFVLHDTAIMIIFRDYSNLAVRPQKEARRLSDPPFPSHDRYNVVQHNELVSYMSY